MQFKFKYIDKIPDTGHSAPALYGSSVHLVLEWVNSGQLDPKKAVQAFEDVWGEPEKYGFEPVDEYPPRTSWKHYLNKGKKSIAKYVDSVEWRDRQVIAVEHGFLVDVGDHQVTGYVDHLEVTQDKKGNYVLMVADHKTGSKNPTASSLRHNIQFCVDEETEALTADGWKRFNELSPGELIMTYNHETSLGEWQPIESVETFDVGPQQLVEMRHTSHSSLTTPNHRWAVERMKTRRGESIRWEKDWKTTAELNSADRIPCAAPVNNLPKAPTYGDDFVRLVAWYWTEGAHPQTDGGNCGVVIGQSQKANPVKVESIRAILTNLFGPATALRLNARENRSIPAWREWIESDECVRFRLNGDASRELLRVVPGRDKIPTPNFLMSLTAEQLKIFIDTSIDADGTSIVTPSTGNVVRNISQAVKGRLDSFQMACSMAGIRTSLRYDPVRGKKYKGRDQWTLSLKEQADKLSMQHIDPVLREYNGVTWCPVTENKTWLARREGHVYFTGNTIYDYASRQKGFWTGNGPDFPGIEDGERWWELTKDLPRLNIWHAISNGKEINAGDRTQEDFDRLHLALNQASKQIEAEIYSLDISGESCFFCPYKEQCGLPLKDDNPEW